MANEVRINGNTLSWGSTICRINGISQNWLTSISYSDKRERAVVYGMGRHHAPRGRTLGKYSVENGKLKGPKGDVQGFLDYLATLSPNGQSFGDSRFDVVLQFIEAEQAVTVELEDCRVVGVSASDEESAEALQDEVEISIMRVRRNGKTLFDSAPL